MAAPTVVHTLPARRIVTAAIAIALESAACVPSIADATTQVAAPTDTVSTVHVRGLDHRAAILLDDGRSRSATFRHLCDRLEQGDVVVLVKTGSNLRTPAQTMFLSAKPGARFVLVTLAVPEMNDVLLAWLAHELQHAVEIAAAPEVVNDETMFVFFCRIGQRMPGLGSCTRKAQRVRNNVAFELSQK